MTAGLEDAVALSRQLGALAADAASGVEAALLRYNADRLPVVHRYQERSRQVSARTGRMRRPRVGGRGDQEAVGGASGHSSEAGTASLPATANPA